MPRLERFLGGSPVAVLFKLLFLSIVIGAIMTGLGLTPGTLGVRLMIAARSMFDLGFGAVEDVGRWLATGAIIVIPVWLLARVAARGR
jgi:hypothetical protein